MFYRLLMPALIGIGLLAGCGAIPATSLRPTPAPRSPATLDADLIDAVLRSTALAQAYGSWPVLAPFPRQIATRACAIPEWQPPVAGGTDFTSVSGMCETSVSQNEGIWIVRFRESWEPARFRFAGDQGAGPFEHTWEFMLDEAKQIIGWTHQGNFPPQFVHTPFH